MTATATAPHPSEARHRFDDAPVIHRYTRAEAIRDGMLTDVTETAREAGFKVPVAITGAVQDQCVRWTEDDARRKPQVHQDAADGRRGKPGLHAPLVAPAPTRRQRLRPGRPLRARLRQRRPRGFPQPPVALRLIAAVRRPHLRGHHARHQHHREPQHRAAPGSAPAPDPPPPRPANARRIRVCNHTNSGRKTHKRAPDRPETGCGARRSRGTRTTAGIKLEWGIQ